MPYVFLSVIQLSEPLIFRPLVQAPMQKARWGEPESPYRFRDFE